MTRQQERAIEPDTSAALHRRAPLLADIAAERILVEMNKLLTGEYMASVLLAYPDVLGVFLPELLPCVGFDQRNVHHCYDVWTHSVYAASAIAPDAVLRWAMLLHDIGKPDCFTVDEHGTGHFYGHPARSAEMAEAICRRLRMDKKSAQRTAARRSASSRWCAGTTGTSPGRKKPWPVRRGSWGRTRCGSCWR